MSRALNNPLPLCLCLTKILPAHRRRSQRPKGPDSSTGHSIIPGTNLTSHCHSLTLWLAVASARQSPHPRPTQTKPIGRQCAAIMPGQTTLAQQATAAQTLSPALTWGFFLTLVLSIVLFDLPPLDYSFVMPPVFTDIVRRTFNPGETSVEFWTQWKNPSDVFSVLLILGGDVVGRALAQVAGSPVSPVAFSFGKSGCNTPEFHNFDLIYCRMGCLCYHRGRCSDRREQVDAPTRLRLQGDQWRYWLCS
jgi:hypothetical protein